MLPNDIHHAFVTSPKTGQPHPAGRFLVADGHVHHLEDYHGLLAREIPEGVVDDFTIAKMAHPGSGLKVAARGAILGGHRTDVLPEADLQPLPKPVEVTPQMARDHAEVKPPSVWHYTRAGHDRPHVLEARGGAFTLDGNPLGDEEVGTILDNVRTRAARLRYARGSAQQALGKIEAQFADLRKADMDVQDALAHLDQLAGDEKTAGAVAALRRHVFEDPMVPGLGNKLAYQKFAAKGTPGATVVGDANFFKQINDVHGHAAGDSAIRAVGSAWRDAAEEVGQSKAHRFGGDEFHAHFPTYEHAADFARRLRSKLDQVPPVGGTHRLSMSLGIGHDFPTADRAAYAAKHGKEGHTPSTVPTMLAHSLHQGFEGAVPLDEHQLKLTPPTLDQRPQVPEKTPLPASPAPPPKAA